MKKIILLALLVMTAACGSAASTAQTNEDANMKENKKILIAYYSKSGNTEQIAKHIQKLTGGDLFEITTDHKYPTEYRPLTEQAKKEIADGFKPKLNKTVSNFADYDIVFIGSPCWWSTVAPAVSSFLSEYDYSGKTVVPFMTHEGSGLGRSVSDIKKLVPSAIMLEGKAFRGSTAAQAQNDVQSWVREIKIVREAK
ncbi:flavodoxin [Elusimicrobium posterum]|uniref:flavodoxin n=1 Tax=Elusimicrobium posterum TaxID=3116653 RepID=UPI003C780DBE